MQKYLALTDVNSFDPLPSLGARLPRDYEVAREPKMNQFREFENGDHSLVQNKPAEQVRQAVVETRNNLASVTIPTGSGLIALTPGGTKIILNSLGKTDAEVCAKYHSALNRAAARLDVDKSVLMLAARRKNADSIEAATKFFDSLQPVGRNETEVRTSCSVEVAAALRGSVYYYGEVKAYVGLDELVTPTPEQYGQMLTWIEQNA